MTLTLTYTDVAGRTFTKNGETMEELVRLAARMTRLGLIESHKIEMAEQTVSLRRDTMMLWAVPRGEAVK